MKVIYGSITAERVGVTRIKEGCITRIRWSRLPRIMRSRPSIFAMRRPA